MTNSQIIRRYPSATSTRVAKKPKRSPTMTFSEVFRLPITIDLHTASSALGICLNTAYRLIQRNDFPCAVLRVGGKYRVPTKSLLRTLEIDEAPVRRADVESGTKLVYPNGGRR